MRDALEPFALVLSFFMMAIGGLIMLVSFVSGITYAIDGSVTLNNAVLLAFLGMLPVLAGGVLVLAATEV